MDHVEELDKKSSIFVHPVMEMESKRKELKNRSKFLEVLVMEWYLNYSKKETLREILLSKSKLNEAMFMADRDLILLLICKSLCLMQSSAVKKS